MAPRLVPIEAAEAWCDRLLEQAEADAAWPRASAAFLRLVGMELELSLARDRDFDRWGLTPGGRDRVVNAARARLAVGQLEAVRRMLREGAPRVRVTSGEVVVRLEMQAQQLAAPAASAEAAVGDPAVANAAMAFAGAINAAALRRRATDKLEPLAALRRGTPRAAPTIRILARPTRKEDATAGPVFGEIRLSFSV